MTDILQLSDMETVINTLKIDDKGEDYTTELAQ